MKIILQKSVDKLGNPGDIAEVADGYARNYLIPRGWPSRPRRAPSSTPSRSSAVTTPGLSKQKGEYEALASKLIAAGRCRSRPAPARRASSSARSPPPTSPRRSRRRPACAVDRRDVHLDEPIRSVGTHEVRVKLFHEVEPVLTVEVVAEG